MFSSLGKIKNILAQALMLFCESFQTADDYFFATDYDAFGIGMAKKVRFSYEPVCVNRAKA